MAITDSEVREQLRLARRIAEAQAARLPNAPVYRLVLDGLTHLEAALPAGSRVAYDVGRPLGVLAVRELEATVGPEEELRTAIFKALDGLRELSGLRYWE